MTWREDKSVFEILQSGPPVQTVCKELAKQIGVVTGCGLPYEAGRHSRHTEHAHGDTVALRTVGKNARTTIPLYKSRSRPAARPGRLNTVNEGLHRPPQCLQRMSCGGTVVRRVCLEMFEAGKGFEIRAEVGFNALTSQSRATCLVLSNVLDRH